LIQQAIHQKLSPLWEAEFSDHSYGFRVQPQRARRGAPGPGYVKAGKTWVVDIDLKNFFDEVNHDKLMHLVATGWGTSGCFGVDRNYLRAPMQHAGRQPARRAERHAARWAAFAAAGQHLSGPAGQGTGEARGVVVRYADDIAIFASSQRSAERIYERIVDWIGKHLKLEVNREKSGVGPSATSSLLGFRIQEDGRVGVSPKAIKKLKERVRQLWDARQSLRSEQLRDQWQRYIRGWWNYFQLVWPFPGGFRRRRGIAAAMTAVCEAKSLSFCGSASISLRNSLTMSWHEGRFAPFRHFGKGT
jgi:RNA-directed DNA polymerase